MQEELRQKFEYRDGMLFYKTVFTNRTKLNSRAGYLSKEGYRVIRHFDKLYKEHRLIWIFHFGEIPKGIQIDHIDLDKSNNRIENLRLATRSQNRGNLIAYKNTTSGLKGVHFHKRQNKWTASIQKENVSKHLGSFDTKVEASEAYKQAALELFGEFANY